MNTNLRGDADKITEYAINSVMPKEAVKRALKDMKLTGDVYVIAVGKAGYSMAEAAADLITCKKGIVITKYEHVKGEIKGFECYEAGHPVPDENGVNATRKALEMVENLTEKDTVLFLLSGGGSALFEKPLVDLEELQDITEQLLKSGADINEMNTIRKRLSDVKGGKLAKKIYPAKVYSIILSDIVGDPLDMIASGPTVADTATSEMAISIIDRYAIKLSDKAKSLMTEETPKEISNVTNIVIGSVRELCKAATDKCKELGYETYFLSDCVCSEAREFGHILGSIARSHAFDGRKLAFISGGETVVHLKGTGMGGRNQEIACGAATQLKGLPNAAVFSVGSDGTDGPTDAAGGYADGDMLKELEEKGMAFEEMFGNNDCYSILKESGGLIITGPTGTNVNDFSVVLIG